MRSRVERRRSTTVSAWAVTSKVETASLCARADLATAHDDAAHRHVALGEPGARFFQRDPHEPLVLGIHAASPPGPVTGGRTAPLIACPLSYCKTWTLISQGGASPLLPRPPHRSAARVRTAKPPPRSSGRGRRRGR